MTDPINKFWHLCKKASREWEKTADTKLYEPFLLDILIHVKSNLQFSEEFQKGFIRIIKNPELAIWEIVMYCMRELRWEGVYKATKEEYFHCQDIRKKEVLENILAAFDDDWEDADLFEYYSS